eukprot:1053937-Rhodomonas_salina.1
MQSGWGKGSCRVAFAMNSTQQNLDIEVVRNQTCAHHHGPEIVQQRNRQTQRRLARDVTEKHWR